MMENAVTQVSSPTYMDYFQFEVSQNDEQELKNLPKLVSIVQFMGIFRNVLRLNLNRQMTFG